MMKTAEQTKSDYVTLMGAELGAAYYQLSAEFLLLKEKWNDYVAIFGTSEERVDLVNKAAPALFGRWQTVMWRDLVLHLCRLADPEKTGKSENLSLHRLVRLVDPSTSNAKITKRWQDVTFSVEFCREWRNKVYAHLDIHVGLSGGAAQLPVVTRAKIKDALAAVEALLIEVHRLKDGSELCFGLDESIDAEELLLVIRDGIEVEAGRRARV